MAGGDVLEIASGRVVQIPVQVGLRPASTRVLTVTPAPDLVFRGHRAVVQITDADCPVGEFSRRSAPGVGVAPAKLAMIGFRRFLPLARIFVADGDVGGFPTVPHRRNLIYHPQLVDPVPARRHCARCLSPAHYYAVVP